MKFVENWRQGHRWFSNQCMAAAFMVQTSWAALDEDMRSTLPKKFVLILTLILLALGIFGRMISQEKKDPPCSDSSKNT